VEQHGGGVVGLSWDQSILLGDRRQSPLGNSQEQQHRLQDKSRAILNVKVVVSDSNIRVCWQHKYRERKDVVKHVKHVSSARCVTR
jgi:hypothetical protein